MSATGDGDAASTSDEEGSTTDGDAASTSDGDATATGDGEEGSTTDEEEVDYFNLHTGKHSTYELDVDRDSDGKVERIHFPHGGWEEVGGAGTDNGDGTETYTDVHGREFTMHKPDSDLNDPDQSAEN